MALEGGDWEEAERYAAALAAFTSAEPLPWSEFFVVRRRALAALGRGRKDEPVRRDLARLRDQADRLNYRIALPAIDQALTGFRT